MMASFFQRTESQRLITLNLSRHIEDVRFHMRPPTRSASAV